MSMKTNIFVKKFITPFYKVFTTLFFDIRIILNKWRGLPYFFKTWREYNYLNKNNKNFEIKYNLLHPVLHERFEDAGSARGHYFFQDLWASSYINNNKIVEIVDVGSRIDGYIAQLLSSTKVTYVDIRPIRKFHENFIFKEGSILNLPFENDILEVISCLHVIEHIGLGRYGDDINPLGFKDGINELKRVIKPGGKVIFGTPVGNERLNFNAHRVFNPQTIVDCFKPFNLDEFSLIDDKGLEVKKNANFSDALDCNYGCGLFIFSRDES